jgi:2-polyprenyl-6-methoxyphenol hydroxylase-like FAD-dependent oxidoreductase
MAVEKIAIVGGGIGGLASAIFLSKKGFQVTVYDKAKRPHPVGAGFLLQPPGQAVLQELGILEKVSEHAIPILGLQSKTTSGRTILDLKYQRLNGTPRHGLGVQRSTIYDALLTEALNQRDLNFIWDSNISQCVTSHRNASIVVNETQQDYDLCILASGANSDLAEKHFKNRVKRAYGWGCLWTTFELPTTLSPNLLHQRCRKANKMMGILPVRKAGDKHEAALYWSVNSQDLNMMDALKFRAVKDEIMHFWPDTCSSIEPLEYADFIPANYNDIWTPNPFVNRLIAIGDISHSTSPQLGQGCTMALLDAWALTRFINKDDEALVDSLEQWWRGRRYQLAYVRHLSKFLTPLFQSNNRLHDVFRDWVMAPIGRLPLFDSLQLKTLASEVFLMKQKSHTGV